MVDAVDASLAEYLSTFCLLHIVLHNQFVIRSVGFHEEEIKDDVGNDSTPFSFPESKPQMSIFITLSCNRPLIYCFSKSFDVHSMRYLAFSNVFSNTTYLFVQARKPTGEVRITSMEASSLKHLQYLRLNPARKQPRNQAQK